MGYICGKLKVETMEQGTARKKLYQTALENDRTNARVNSDSKLSLPIRYAQPQQQPFQAQPQHQQMGMQGPNNQQSQGSQQNP